MNKKNISKIPDADLSSAGDDFHVLWTMQRSFEMLSFDKNALKAIYIEDVDKKFSNSADPTGEKLLGIDLSEYYGGKNFDDANKVVVSQLKYSTRRASESYTFSKLYKGKKNNSHDGSIIHRLSTIYKTFIDKYGRSKVLDKLRIKLISNRDISSSHLQILNEIKYFLDSTTGKISFKKVLDQNFIKYRSSLEKLKTASKLTSTEFSDFLRILDFKDCGTDSRSGLQLLLIKSISETSVTYRTQYNALYLMIWNKCMPQSDDNRIITVTELIASLGFEGGSVENLFPVAQNFIQLKEQVERKQLGKIIKIINRKEDNIICLHGGAGSGKSTIVQQIKNSLPKYSECIIFDCYGKGAYQYSTDKRHLPKYSLVQLANELAKKLGTSFLLIKGESDDVYIREFKKRISKAVEILTRRNPNASLNIIIDAADNSVVASKLHNDACFIDLLMNFNIPEGCNFIFTTRSFRKDSLKLPKNHKDIRLNNFSLSETKLLAKNYFSKITHTEAEEFHKYTDGVPRAQFYALELKLNGINEIVNYLKPNGKKVEDFILDKIHEAEQRLGNKDKHQVQNFLSLLITLPRPVPLNYLAEIMKVKEDFLVDLKSELWTGLICENDQFEFRDEDFENFIREKYILGNTKLYQIADVFLKNAPSDFYAAKSLGFILYNSSRYDDLKEIVLKKEFLDSINDPVRKKEIYIDRVTQAIKLSKSEDDYITLFKLIIIAAEEAKTDKALSNLLTQHPQLIMQYGDEFSLQKYKLNSERATWGGSFHLRLSAIYSRNNKEVALKHLNTAKEWLYWKHNNQKEIENDFNNNYSIDDFDISCETEAVLRIFGLKKCIKSLFKWNPLSSRLLAGNHLIENVFQFSSNSDLKIWFTDIQCVRLDIQIFITCKAFLFKKDIPFDLKELSEKILRCKKIKFKIGFHSIIVDFCEILLYHNYDRTKILDILSLVKYSISERIPYFQNQFDDGKDSMTMDIALRSRMLKHSIGGEKIVINDIYPKKFVKINEINDYEKKRGIENDKKEFDNFYGINLLIYQLRSLFFLRHKEKHGLVLEFENICSIIKGNYDYDYKAGYRSQEQKLFFVKKLAEIISLMENQELTRKLILSFNKVPFIKTRFRILDETKYLKSFDEVNLRVLYEIDEKLSEINVTSQELVDDYIQCTFISSKIDPNIGKYFFEKSIEAVKEIEYNEAFSKIRCLYNLTGQGINHPKPELAYKLARFVEYCDVSLEGYEKKHFPYENSLMAIGNLDLPSMYSTACRWHHRGIIDLTDYTLGILNKSFRNGFINHKEATSLLPLYQLEHYSDTLIDFYRMLLLEFDKKNDSIGKTNFIEYLIKRYTQIGDKNILKTIFAEIKSGAFIQKKTLDKLAKYLLFLDQINNDKKAEYSNNYLKDEYNYNINIDNLNYNSSTELEEIIEEIILKDESFGRWKVDKFLSDIKNKINVNEYISHLNALVQVNSNILNFYSLEDALKSRLTDWSYHPLVVKWKKENFSNVLLSWFNHFNENRSLSLYGINQLTKLFGLDENTLANKLIEIIPEKIEELSDESIYDLFELIKIKLSKEQSEKLLNWALDRWSIKIKDDVADGLWNQNLLPSKNKDEVLCDILRFLLGHPNKEYRWRAVHSIKELVNHNTRVLECLLDKQNVGNCVPFQNKNFKFYWISAKLYLWIAIEKLSINKADLIVPYKSHLFKEIQNTELPHVLIKYFIKKTCLNILKEFPNTFNEGEIGIINNCLESKFEKLEEERFSREQRKYNNNKDKKWRFKFDTMDTLPYWYNSLGAIYNLTEYDVADIAEKYIIEKWGYADNLSEIEFITDQLSNNQWNLTSKRHGTSPQIETFKTYLEYHSMFCAAGFLLENEPQVIDESYWRTWYNWLNSEANTWSDFWVSDLVDSSPLQEKFWKIEYDIFDENWRDSIEENKFDKEVGFEKMYNKNFIIPHGYYQRYLGENLETIYIRSALVSSQTSEALLRTLQSAKEHHNYAFPIEEDGERHEINNNEFVFTSWIKYRKSERESVGLDKHDFLYQDIGYGLPCFADKIVSLFPILFNYNHKKATLDNEVISNVLCWNKITDQRYRSSDMIESSGEILEVDYDFILSILKKKKMDLIIKCQIEKQLKERYYEYDDSGRSWEHTKLYLIKSDGTIRTLRGENIELR